MRLRAQGAAIPLLLITGAPTPAIFERAARFGIAVLEKPPDETALLKFIDSHC